MKSQQIIRKTGLMVLWSLFPFGKSNKASQYTDEIEMETGGQFKLYANYPNPFRTITILYFALMHDSHVRIDIADASGRKVMTLIHEQLEAGVQRIPLYRVTNGVTLSAGVYTYQLTVTNENGKFSQKKFITVLEAV
jgi:hypothetical protein